MVSGIVALLLAASMHGAVASPEVRPDHTVTFRFRDVGAAHVKLELEGYDAFEMTKGANSVWTSVKWLKGKGVNVDLREVPGRHAWVVWRRNLADFVQAIFR